MPTLYDGSTETTGAITKDGFVVGHPGARFVYEAPGAPLHGAVHVLHCGVNELDGVLWTLSKNGFRRSFYTIAATHGEPYHWTCSDYGMRLYSGTPLGELA